MKKKSIIIFVILLILFMPYQTVKAASGINSEEQAIINRIKAGYTVDGKRYYVESQYINQGVNYLSRDGVDLTAEQRVSILAKLDEMAPQGVAKGYLKPVAGDNSTADKTSNSKDSTKANESKQSPSKSKNDSSNNDLNNDAKQNSTSTTKVMSMSEIIDSAKEITSDMNISVSYDLEANEVKIINSEGKAVIAANKTIKYTGFSLNTTVIIISITLFMLCLSIIAAAKLHLFTSREDAILQEE